MKCILPCNTVKLRLDQQFAVFVFNSMHIVCRWFVGKIEHVLTAWSSWPSVSLVETRKLLPYLASKI
jgi:hypothetical protein